MQKNGIWLILAGILVMAAILRLYNLAAIPPSPYLDEVSNGYNAYSLMLTGNDEYGRHLPLLLQAYNDFRPALFVYTLIPFIKLFGLTVFAIRVPAALLGIATTLCLFFLTRELFPITSKLKHTTRNWIALSSAFLYAISPWNIYSSRISDEINMSLSYFVFALTFFLYAIHKKDENWKSNASFILSVVLFVIAFYAYHGFKLFLPFFIIGVSILYYKELFTKIKVVIVSIFLAGILLMPLYLAFTTPGTTVRLGAVNAFTQQPELMAESAKRELYDQSHNDRLGALFDNRRVTIYLEVIKNSLKNLDPSWLFLQQRGNKTFRVPDFGPFYLFELPILLIGIFFLIKQEGISKKVKVLLFFWVFISTLPSGISSEAPHLNRTNTMLPAFTILNALGLYAIIAYFNRQSRKYTQIAGLSAVTSVIFVSFIWFLHAYFVEYPLIYSNFYQYGNLQAFQYVKQIDTKYKTIVVSNAATLLESYIYFLFATKFDPYIYQQMGGTKSAFFTNPHLIGKYDFHDPNMNEDELDQHAPKTGEKVLFVVNPNELHTKVINALSLHLIQTFKFIDGTDAIWIYEGEL